MTEREAVIIAVDGHRGEAAPLAGMSIDVIEDAVVAAEALAACMPVTIESPADASALADRLTAAPAARFAIETALLAALARDTSIAALFGPVHALTFAFVVDDAAEAVRAVERGARCLKIKARDPDRVLAIAAAVPGIALRVDANRSWPRAEVPAWMAQLPAMVEYVEEPCENAYELLATRLPCRIALDESLVTLDPDQLAHAVASPGLAALVVKPTLLGGFARCLELAALARDHGVHAITSHTLEGPIGFAACLELARIIGADVPVGLGV